jgi:hypothetical protein
MNTAVRARLVHVWLALLAVAVPRGTLPGQSGALEPYSSYRPVGAVDEWHRLPAAAQQRYAAAFPMREKAAALRYESDSLLRSQGFILLGELTHTYFAKSPPPSDHTNRLLCESAGRLGADVVRMKPIGVDFSQPVSEYRCTRTPQTRQKCEGRMRYGKYEYTCRNETVWEQKCGMESVQPGLRTFQSTADLWRYEPDSARYASVSGAPVPSSRANGAASPATSLLEAVAAGDTGQIRMMLATASAEDLGTALLVAADSGRARVAELLLSADGGPIAPGHLAAALEIALSRERVDIAVLLRARGGVIRPAGAQSLLSNVAAWRRPGNERSAVAEVRLLVAAGADVNLPDESGWHPIGYAAGGGFPEVVAALLDLGARIDQRVVSSAWPDPDTPLVLAIASSRVDTVRLLLARGADRRLKVRGLTPLQYARHVTDRTAGQQMVRLLK